MKILHTTDLHFNKRWFAWIDDQQDSYDIFCVTGDFLEYSKEETLQKQIEWVAEWMKQFKKPLFICSGNHDIEEMENDDWFNHISNVYSDNTIKTIDGVKFGCIPYIAPEFYDYAGCDVILYHIPPANTKTSIHKQDNVDWGDKDFYRNIKNGTISPKITLCGHLHYPLSTTDKINNTVIYNPGAYKKNTIPNHNVIKV